MAKTPEKASPAVGRPKEPEGKLRLAPDKHRKDKGPQTFHGTGEFTEINPVEKKRR